MGTALGSIFGSGGRTTETKTETKTNNLGSQGDGNEHNLTNLDINGGKKSTVNVTVTDYGAINSALDTVTANNKSAFDFTSNSLKEVTELGSQSLDLAESLNDNYQRLAQDTISSNAKLTSGTINAFADASEQNADALYTLARDIKTGDLQLGKTVIWGIGFISLLVGAGFYYTRAKR